MTRHYLSVFLLASLAMAAQAQPITLMPPEALATKTYAVVVGVADYAAINKLRYSDDDAYHFHTSLINPQGWAVPRNQTILLVDEDATKANIMAALQAVAAAADANDNIIFYYSGHGAQGGLFPYDFDPDTEANFLTHAEIKTILKQSPSPYKFCIVDACHSGAFADSWYFGIISDILYGYKNSGITMMLASGVNETSLEHPVVRQGFFTYFLIEGLEGSADTNKDGQITIQEIYEYVLVNVRLATNGKQNPVLAGDVQRFAVVKK
jgi:uncharacterized caspase-like protein